MSAPLDLRAVETRHKETMNGFSSNPGSYVDSAADVPALLVALRAHREALKAARQTHLIVDEDCWYSCPLARDERGRSECRNDGLPEECNCGADQHNAAIDAVLASVVDVQEGARRE